MLRITIRQKIISLINSQKKNKTGSDDAPLSYEAELVGESSLTDCDIVARRHNRSIGLYSKQLQAMFGAMVALSTKSHSRLRFLTLTAECLVFIRPETLRLLGLSVFRVLLSQSFAKF